ncbi:MAG TPA: DUF692 domain-containing protein [Pseudomonadales bacterium]|nr:DUF692 domain-containing protein [Pseudomonadales bacterium]
MIGSASKQPLAGAGLGLRRALLGALENESSRQPDFLEVVPENWLRIGGQLRHRFDALAQQRSLVCHGLSLSLGGPDPLDWKFLAEIRDFLQQHRVLHYTEHLSYCSDGGHLYDLAPIPFTAEAVRYVAERIRQVQDFLGQHIGIENISYYAAPGAQISEIEFISSVLEEADCLLLLDVNNLYVNSINHSYDPLAYLHALPAQRIGYLHVAGHYDEAEDLKIDTHGMPVIDPVWRLLEQSYRLFGVRPTLLERDFNFPPHEQLLDEVEQIRLIQRQAVAGPLPLHGAVS